MLTHTLRDSHIHIHTRSHKHTNIHEKTHTHTRTEKKRDMHIFFFANAKITPFHRERTRRLSLNTSPPPFTDTHINTNIQLDEYDGSTGPFALRGPPPTTSRNPDTRHSAPQCSRRHQIDPQITCTQPIKHKFAIHHHTSASYDTKYIVYKSKFICKIRSIFECFGPL